mmetsp:Transcript_52354/g.154506  ORF Transcript_52354/g.154506 Transcript_52354/m.154506 type:complete len:325 (-) Transcript_52354:1779-2753(-)
MAREAPAPRPAPPHRTPCATSGIESAALPVRAPATCFIPCTGKRNERRQVGDPRAARTRPSAHRGAAFHRDRARRVHTPAAEGASRTGEDRTRTPHTRRRTAAVQMRRRRRRHLSLPAVEAARRLVHRERLRMPPPRVLSRHVSQHPRHARGRLPPLPRPRPFGRTRPSRRGSVNAVGFECAHDDGATIAAQCALFGDDRNRVGQVEAQDAPAVAVRQSRADRRRLVQRARLDGLLFGPRVLVQPLDGALQVLAFTCARAWTSRRAHRRRACYRARRGGRCRLSRRWKGRRVRSRRRASALTRRTRAQSGHGRAPWLRRRSSCR